MSQYPSPHHQPALPPPPGYDSRNTAGSYQNYLARFSRAGMLLLIMGGLMFSCGGLCAGMSPIVPWDQVLQDASLRGAVIPADATPAIMRTLFLVLGGASFVFGFIQIVLGIFVRKGGFASAIVAIVFTALMLAVCLFFIASGVIVGQAGGSSPGGICMFIVPAGLFTLSIVWLSMAVKGHSAMRTARAEFDVRYWHYVQAQQGHMGQQSGVPQPPPGQSPVSEFNGTIGLPVPPPPRDNESK